MLTMFVSRMDMKVPTVVTSAAASANRVPVLPAPGCGFSRHSAPHVLSNGRRLPEPGATYELTEKAIIFADTVRFLEYAMPGTLAATQRSRSVNGGGQLGERQFHRE